MDFADILLCGLLCHSSVVRRMSRLDYVLCCGCWWDGVQSACSKNEPIDRFYEMKFYDWPKAEWQVKSFRWSCTMTCTMHIVKAIMDSIFQDLSQRHVNKSMRLSWLPTNNVPNIGRSRDEESHTCWHISPNSITGFLCPQMLFKLLWCFSFDSLDEFAPFVFLFANRKGTHKPNLLSNKNCSCWLKKVLNPLFATIFFKNRMVIEAASRTVNCLLTFLELRHCYRFSRHHTLPSDNSKAKSQLLSASLTWDRTP